MLISRIFPVLHVWVAIVGLGNFLVERHANELVGERIEHLRNRPVLIHSMVDRILSVVFVVKIR